MRSGSIRARRSSSDRRTDRHRSFRSAARHDKLRRDSLSVRHLERRWEAMTFRCRPPARAGTHTPQKGDVVESVMAETSVVMGPRLRGAETGTTADEDGHYCFVVVL